MCIRPKHKHRCRRGPRYDVRDTPSQSARNAATSVSRDCDEICSHLAGVVSNRLSDVLTDNNLSGREKTILAQFCRDAEQIALRGGDVLVPPRNLLIGDPLL